MDRGQFDLLYLMGLDKSTAGLRDSLSGPPVGTTGSWRNSVDRPIGYGEFTAVSA